MFSDDERAARQVTTAGRTAIGVFRLCAALFGALIFTLVGGAITLAALGVIRTSPPPDIKLMLIGVVFLAVAVALAVRSVLLILRLRHPAGMNEYYGDGWDEGGNRVGRPVAQATVIGGRTLGPVASRVVGGAVFTVAWVGLFVAAFFSGSAAVKSSYVQSNGVSEQAVVRDMSVRTDHHCEKTYGRFADKCSDMKVEVTLTKAVAGETASVVHAKREGNFVRGEKVTVLVDPKDPGYSEFFGAPYVPKSDALMLSLLGVGCLIVSVLMFIDGVRRYRHQHNG